MEEETQTKNKAATKRAKRILASALIMLVLFVAAGVAYTWFTGQQGPAKTAQEAPSAQATTPEPIKPTAPSAQTQESAAIEYLSTPIAPGSPASMTVATVATSTCNISVTYNKVASVDPGLKPKTADDFGNVSWDWTVPASAPTGTWPVKVTCVRGAKSAVVIGDLQVARQ